MHSLRLSIVGVAGAVAMSIGGAPAAYAGCTDNLTVDRELNVRRGPGTTYQPVGRIPGAACRIQIGRCDDGWCEVRWRNLSGFASEFYLERTAARGDEPERRDVADVVRRWAGIADRIFDRITRDRNWENIGTLRVSADRDRDVIQLDRSDGRFDQLRMRVRGGDVDFRRVVVVYGNGQRDDLDFNRVIERGGESGEIDLRGARGRFIDRIVFVYQQDRRRGPAPEVQVWAHKTAEGRGGGRDRDDRTASFGRNWEQLGSARVDRQRDRDVIQVGRAEGRFDALGLIVTRNDVRIRRMLVRYGNGVEHEVDVERRLREGEKTDAIELRGSQGRGIDRVTLIYDTVTRGPRATVELWGREG